MLPRAATAVLLLCSTAILAATPDGFRIAGKRAKADVFLAEPDTIATTVSPTADETAHGFVVFARPAAFVIKPDYSPQVADRCTALEARDCPGQYGSFTFAIVALKEADVSLAIGNLSGPNGATIAAENLETRAIRYVKVIEKKKSEAIPLLVESFEKLRVGEKHLQQFWINYYVPESTAPGVYEGKLQLLVSGTETAALPVRLEVHPFKLLEPGNNLYIYSNNSTEAKDHPRVLADLIDQRCHGMNAATLTLPVTAKGDLSRESTAAMLDLYKQAGFAHPQVHIGLWNRITSEWLNTPDASIKMYGPWFRYYPFTEKLDTRYVETVKMIRDEAKARGLVVILAVADEAGSHPWTTEATQHYNDLIREKLPDVTRELTVGGGWAMKRDEDELWKGRIQIWTTNRWLPDKLDRVRQNDPTAKIQIYNMAGNGSGAGGIESPRVMYGFFNWKAKSTGAAQWVYYHGATPESNYAWPAENPAESCVPTLRWEMVREGAKDLRYLATLEDLLKTKGGPVADDARKLLDGISNQIVLRTDAYDPIGGGRVPAPAPGTCDRWRAQIADLIKRLSEK